MISRHEVRRYVFCLALFFVSICIMAQTDGRYLIETNDGNTYRGFIIQKEVQSIEFQTDNIGVITIQFDDVKKIERIGSNEPARKQSNVDYSDPNEMGEQSQKPSRFGPRTYFARPSSFGLKKGEAYYQNIWIFLNEFNVGITDNFSLGLGGVLLPFGDPGIPVWVNPKLTLPVIKDKVNVGFGSFNGLLMETDPYHFGFLYTDIGIGSAHNHINVGLGTSYEDGVWLDEAVFTFSGTIRLNRNTSLSTENYVTQLNSFYSIQAYQHLSDEVVLQWGMLFFSDQNDLFPIPLLGILIPIKVDL